MKRPKKPLILEKRKKALLGILDSIDPDRADSALRAVIDESLSMLQDLNRHKPCTEKKAWKIYEDHKSMIKKRFNKIFPEKPAGINDAVNIGLESMKHLLLMQKGKTWK